jgi:hypothetical protein
MLTEPFSRLFGRLLTRWEQYQKAPRDPARVTELAAMRIALDEVRADISDERVLVSGNVVPRIEAPRVAIPPSDIRRLQVAAIGRGSTS